MQKIIVTFLTSAALVAGVYAQQLAPVKVPASVMASFHSKFPGIAKAEWKLKTDKNYEAEFRLKGVDVAAKFGPNGEWLETETTIRRGELPRDVVSAISRDYKAYKIIETQKVEPAGNKPILYEVHLANAKEVLKIQFEVNGTVSAKSTKAK